MIERREKGMVGGSGGIGCDGGSKGDCLWRLRLTKVLVMGKLSFGRACKRSVVRCEEGRLGPRIEEAR